MKIIHISAECYPIAKVGGLADVVGALPKYQNNLKCDSSVIMPFYNNKFTQSNEFTEVYRGQLQLGFQSQEYRIVSLPKKELGYELFCVDIPYLLHTSTVYSDNDTFRFLAFQIATLDWILQLKEKPKIVHCHDHHSGLVPFMMAHSFKYESLCTIPTIFTIHNGQYQGWFGHDKIPLLPAFDSNNFGLLDWNGMINPMAAAIKCAWKVTTVSPSYLEELMYEANGLESLLRQERHKCVGILNGIDAEVWNPNKDTYIEKNFTLRSIKNGKAANKKYLCDTFNLDINKPLFTFIGRLVEEKAADLLPSVFRQVLSSGKINVLILGSGSDHVEGQLSALKHHFYGVYDAYIGYNEKLAHTIYAGADFLLMPSRIEPCGLNQMYALRYGTVPVVHRIGGLQDTVLDVGDGGFGICHDQVSVSSIVHAISRAYDFYNNEKAFADNRKTLMQIDHSWDNSAQTYIDLYNHIK